MTKSSVLEQAYTIAKTAFHRAHAPYSHFQVGAALAAKDIPEIIGGCNVENVSFGATICAERTALGAMVSKHGAPLQLELILVVTDREHPAPPCGICLQTLAEFSADSTTVVLATPQRIVTTCKFFDLLPHAFRTLK